MSSYSGLCSRLWFDVENRKDTTWKGKRVWKWKLWFDVENRKDTTGIQPKEARAGCGLM